jgi:multidrug efflux pump subunit AcrA (membrane-fusion protein)
MQQAGFGQQAAVRQTELDLQREQATQGLGAEAFMQQQQLGQQASMATASNALAAAQSDQQAALSSGNQAAALEASRRAQTAQIQVDMASQTQRLGAGAAGQQAQLQQAFRQQQMAGAQQLADIGGMRQGAVLGAGGMLGAMGADQERAQRLQQAWDYDQFLRRQEGPGEALALSQAFLPGGGQQQWQRKPSMFGQIAGGLLGVAGLGVQAYTGRGGYSDVRMKDNIEYVGEKNGFNLYEFNYLGSDNRYRGVMAQEVMKQRPDAVEDRNGLYWVNYDAIGIQLEAV